MFRTDYFKKSTISRFHKSIIVFFADLFFTLTAVMLVICINTEKNIITFASQPQIITQLMIVFLVQSATYYLFGLYRGVWRFASIPDLVRISKACLTGTIILAFCHYIFYPAVVIPKSSFALFCLFSICLLSTPRLYYRWLKDSHRLPSAGRKVLVVGAGSAGESILRELKRKNNDSLFPMGLLDDDPAKHGIEIHGIRVLGTVSDLPQVVSEKNIELILIAIPRASSAQMRRIVMICEEARISYRTLPSINDIASGKTDLSTIREVTVEDLLSRDPVHFDPLSFSTSICGETILVTGAGGSIGSELCRKIAACNPAALVLIDSSEYNLFKIQADLAQHFSNLRVYFYLVSITHESYIHSVLAKHLPKFIFHAAAYKHVPLLEPLASLAIENNIHGTQVIAEAALRYNVEKFILVSTDKAVNPTNIMGATKRYAEILCQCLNQQNKTRFITVRFGNVLGSTGSVIPLFKEQIAKGGPVTITHPDMERYFMTISEAAQLIIQTITLDSKGDVYVLDMGEPVKIKFLAEQMIKLSGHIPNVDVSIIYTGLRPGEKINEELFYNYEKVEHLGQDKILRVAASRIDVDWFMRNLTALIKAAQMNDPHLREQLFNIIRLCSPTNDIPIGVQSNMESEMV